MFFRNLQAFGKCTGITFVLTGANVSDKDTNVFKVLVKRLYGKWYFIYTTLRYFQPK